MKERDFNVRHLDLSAGLLDDYGGSSPALTVFWWKDLPIGMHAALWDELPYGRARLRQFAAEFGAAQLAARRPGGVPLRATYQGCPHHELTLEAALQGTRLLERLDGLADLVPTAADDLSVVVCTRDRGAALSACLTSLANQKSAPGEIVVVDNSKEGSARSVCSGLTGITYAHEPRSGLSVARNAGIAASSKPILAFTDDDVEVHPGWTSEIVAAFTRHDVDAVTGLVLPARLDTPAQRSFQFDMGGFGTTFVPLLFDRRFFIEMRPHGAHVWKIGAGANMAFRRSAFERVGLFDERLGAGASGCSEDSELWYRLLAAGGTCLYEPRAVVFHEHRRDWRGLKRQARAYMKGHVSALVAQYDQFGDRGNLHRIARQLPGYFARTLLTALFEGPAGRLGILAAEFSGWLAGLQYLARPGWRGRRAALASPAGVKEQAADGSPR